ncbi:EGF-like domain-containing protein [Meloidogyne graminicola]|uniref:EGF-like domain-containing protein n=1 Tax=Meloidogyne graminicola TaxID=189291 RepID=A0A8S9ZWB5_9BILA|nr:EGF-like domain-containing protein [Meloidogyne graminicola]
MLSRIYYMNIFDLIFILLVFENMVFGRTNFQNPIPRMTRKDDNCPKNMFLCTSTLSCIPRSWVCDQEVDCKEGEDEKNCDNPSPAQCQQDEYTCRTTQDGVRTDNENPWLSHLSPVGLYSHLCIPLKWKCDGEVDCLLKDDEEGCPQIKCDDNHFECKGFDNSMTSCIPKEWVCDGQTDCMDMKDEANCINIPKNKCDNATEFTCNDGQCIYRNWLCDGDNDCKDGSDEIDCKESTCESAGKFKCKSSNFCIHSKWRCDGEPDCPDHSDEIFDGSDELSCLNGGKCSNQQKACKDGRCLDANLWCDGTDDCQDGSDEKNCTSPVKLSAHSCDSDNEYTCPNESPTRCIRLKDLCNGNSAANDCTKSVCKETIVLCKENDNACSCRNTGFGTGKVCHCHDGYQLKGGVCTDINECEQLGTCDQICINKPGGYQCDCYPGYRLAVPSKNMDKTVPHKCRARGSDPLLLLANRAAIRQYDIVTNKYHPLINKLESAVALDYWHENKTLVWSDVSKEQIVICSGIHGLGDLATFESINNACNGPNLTRITDDVTTPDGLAIDWVHGLIFWTDTGTDTINVYDLNTKKRTVIISGDSLDEPRAIAVDPSAGLIFWTDWGENARIERAGMDGKDRRIIIKGNTIRWPNGLAVDILDKKIYWADAKTKQISSSDYWGDNVRTILHSHQYLRHPFSLAVFEERLYWTDWDQEGVLSVNKFHGGEVKKLMSGVTGPMTVRVYHEQAQPKHANKCKYSSCEHICLPKALFKGGSKDSETPLKELPFSCACERGFQIDVGNSSLCVPLNPIGIIADAATFLHIKEESNVSISTYMFGLLIVCAAFAILYIYQNRRPRSFAVLHFDNPIYRRTVEADLDADLENPSAFQDSQSKLVLKVPIQKREEGNTISSNSINMNDTNEYGYEQPQAPKF